MKRFATALKAAQAQGIVGGKLIGNPDTNLSKVSEAIDADAETIIFLEQEKLLEVVNSSASGLIITTEEYAPRLPGKNLLIVEKPYFALMVLITYWQKLESINRSYIIHPSAVVASDIRYEGEVSIAPHAVIGEGCVLGKGVVISAGCSIGKNVSIGAGTMLYAGVIIYEDCIVGKNCILHSGCVIGADGFGFMLMEGTQQKIPQVGNVEIGDYVEIGANTCIDRATLGTTKIGKGTKIDNLVQIGHNCIIGEHSILCSQVGLAGSTIVGDYVYLAGQVGAAGHITIGTRAMVGAQSGIVGNVAENARFFGSPAMEAGEMKRIFVAQKHLPEMLRAFQKAKKNTSEQA
ncbi:MAG: UDP-3-O-(3-hydroxymyristoyl)glucosamine N-acyltransferase [Candidatus Cloacimonetes bacterium HGW-Cloacimonetes-3]|jgi:UDP-3-O-[3-hydroxymyristoyl] glucosamine N-acyltransferase|nr:MAG: UDP-3-O-(3-hydroxymyristoyl)glucosamine N-acyltransferase [Candidatus Cloacimonetes bacterium HGW-Cloacimonetes-3]